jgi:hypothetical protein
VVLSRIEQVNDDIRLLTLRPVDEEKVIKVGAFMFPLFE